MRWWPMVNRRTLRADAMAGLTNAFVVLPQGVAFALIAGLPPVYGLYSAMVPPIIAGLFGSSRHLISGPTTAISIVVFAAVSKVAEPGSAEFIRLALTLTLLAGVYQLVLGLVRMGALVNFISHSVVVGFTAGAAVLIATSQLKHYFGVPIPAGDSFLETWVDLYHKATAINPYVAGVATLTLVVAVVFMKWLPRWPGMLIAMVAGTGAAIALGSEQHGISLVGEVPRQLPPLSVPDFSLKAIKNMGGAALAIAMLGLVEAVSIARSIATRSGQRIDGNQEFIGQGLANVVGSFFSSYASSGSFTRSGLNYSSGAATPMSAVFAALSLAVIVLLVAPYAAYLPTAAMAGILLVVAYRLIDAHHIRTILRASKRESVVLVTTLLATLFVELEFAIYVGVLLSLVFFLLRTSRPKIVTRVPDPKDPERRFVTDRTLPECPQLRMVRIDGSLFFGAVDHVQQTLQAMVEADPERKHILIIGDGINIIDIAGAEMLVQEAKRLRDMGGGLYIAKLKGTASDTMKRGGYMEKFGPENIFVRKADAVAAIFRRLDWDKCARCTRRIFEECRSVEPAPPDTAPVSRTAS
jgi:SulP family sulfate permease